MVYKDSCNKNNYLSHELFFRTSIAIPEVAKELIEMYIPRSILSKIDLTSLKQIPETFVETKLQKHMTDVVFSCNTRELKDKRIFIYVLHENHNTPDYWLSLRILRSVTMIAERFLQTNPWAKSIPLIYPLVIYNGSSRYNAPRSVCEIFDYPEISHEMLNNNFMLKDLKEEEDEDLKQKIWGGTLLFFMKHAHKNRSALSILKEMVGPLRKVYESKQGEQFIYSLLRYIRVEDLEEGEQQQLKKLLHDITDKETTGKFMTTLAKLWLEEGQEKGMKIGFNKVSRKLRQK